MKIHDAGICRECGEVYDISREICCPVLDSGMLTGIVTQTDLLHASFEIVKYMHWKILDKWDI